MLRNPDDIVGHKTYSTGQSGPSGFPLLRHAPLTRAEADAILASVKQEEERRAAEMPDEHAAIAAMFRAWLRLKELGWKEAIYCPKDGTPFHAIEPGSTGIHECCYRGTWPNGSWWVAADGDLWPFRPILFKAIESPQAPDAVDPSGGSEGKTSTRAKEEPDELARVVAAVPPQTDPDKARALLRTWIAEDAEAGVAAVVPPAQAIHELIAMWRGRAYTLGAQTETGVYVSQALRAERCKVWREAADEAEALVGKIHDHQ